LISIAIPDSMFLEDDALREKTVKVGLIARSAAIFGVERIYIYRDPSRNSDDDYETAKVIFEYMETPQYLRKRLYGRRKELEYVGLLPPLRIPSHLKEYTVEPNEIREAVIVLQNGELMADIGANKLAMVEGRVHESQRVTLRVTSVEPLIVRVEENPVEQYWGYEIRRAPSLARFLKSSNFELLIMTSRLGEAVDTIWKDFCAKCSGSPRILICFGSPQAGVDKLLKLEKARVKDFPSIYVNTFPGQKVETVRLEEAILGTLALVNVASKV
jgi:predicted SPOUT superfamily RNA methylase MTH1